jgi:hypothetical protein
VEFIWFIEFLVLLLARQINRPHVGISNLNN